MLKGAADVLCRSNELFQTVIVSILRLGSGGHSPTMIPVSHRSTDRKELGVSAPVLRENSRGKVQNVVTDCTAVRGTLVCAVPPDKIDMPSMLI